VVLLHNWGMKQSTPIRVLRRSQELSQDELAFRSGIERTRLCRAERGYLVLTVEELVRVAKALHVEVERLLATT